MIKRSAVFSMRSGAAVAAGVLSCDRRKESRVRDEAAIRSRIEKLVEGIQAMDLVRILPIYAPEIVSFDIEPKSITAMSAHMRPGIVRPSTTSGWKKRSPMATVPM